MRAFFTRCWPCLSPSAFSSSPALRTLNPNLNLTMTTDTLAAPASKRSALWAYPFRPFFIAVGLYAILAVGGWLGVLLLGWPLNGEFLNMQWHSHEKIGRASCRARV